MHSFSLCDDPLILLDALFHRQEEKDHSQDDLSGDLSVETVSGGSIYIPSGELTNPEEEMKKLTAEKERLENELKRILK